MCIVERLKSKFNASVAEVELNDVWKMPLLEFHVFQMNPPMHSMMANMVNFIENDGRAVLFDYTTEIIHIG